MNEINNSSKEITSKWIFELLPKLLTIENNERQKAEKVLEQYVYEPSLYQNLIEIGLYNNTISENEKLQIFILLRKLIKDNLLFNKLSSTPLKMKTAYEENSSKIELIVDNLKIHLKSYLNKGDFSQNYNKIISDIVCLISVKYFQYKLFYYYHLCCNILVENKSNFFDLALDNIPQNKNLLLYKKIALYCNPKL